MEDNVDQLSFASILAGVQQMRESYDDFIGQDVSGHEDAKGVQEPETLERRVQESETLERRVQESETSERRVQEPETLERRVQESETLERRVQESETLERRVQTDNVPKKTPTGTTPASMPGRRGPRNVHSYTSVQVAPSQKGNPLLEAPQMKLTPWSYNAQILLDYYINATLQVLFLSLKYHKLRPEYVWRRIDKLKGSSSTQVHTDDDALRVLLVVVDIDSPQEPIRKLLVMCIKNDLTMVVAWSFEEAGNYIAALKSNEMARAKVNVSIQGVKKTDFNLNIVNSLTTVRAVNKTDVANLLANCKSFRNIVVQSRGDGLAAIPGLGGRKVANLKDAFHQPFVFNKEYGSGA